MSAAVSAAPLSCALTFEVAADIPVPRWVQRKIQRLFVDIATGELEKVAESGGVAGVLVTLPVPPCCYRPKVVQVIKDKGRFHFPFPPFNPIKETFGCGPGKLLLLPLLMVFQAMNQLRGKLADAAEDNMGDFVRSFKLGIGMPAKSGHFLPLPPPLPNAVAYKERASRSGKVALTFLFLTS